MSFFIPNNVAVVSSMKPHLVASGRAVFEERILSIAEPLPTPAPLLAALIVTHTMICFAGPVVYWILMKYKVIESDKQRTLSKLACLMFTLSNLSEISGHILDGLEYGWFSSDGIPNVLFRVFMDTGNAFLASALAPSKYINVYSLAAFCTLPLSLVIGFNKAYRNMFTLRYGIMMVHVLNCCLNLTKRTRSLWSIMYFLSGIPVMHATLFLRSSGNPVWHLFPTFYAACGFMGVFQLSCMHWKFKESKVLPVLCSFMFLLGSLSFHKWLATKLM